MPENMLRVSKCSMNMVDPRTFKPGAGVGEWVDAMVRVEGPVALVAVDLDPLAD